MIPKCRTCAYKGTFQDGSFGCQRTKTKIDVEKDYCSYHMYGEIEHCDICSQLIINPSDAIIITEPSIHVVCSNCISSLYSCQLCKSFKDCAFKRNEFGLPPTINQTVRKGIMTVQTQVRNPELVNKTCKAGCPCWNGSDCARETEGSCKNHNSILT